MGKKLLVTTPFLDTIGGTEIEAVLTAMHFYDTHQYKKVAIFSPRKGNASLFKEIIEERNISFLNYPAFFNSKSVLFLNRIFIRKNFTNKRGHYSWLLNYFEIPSLQTECIGVGFSIFLGSITCPGSMGMISAVLMKWLQILAPL